MIYSMTGYGHAVANLNGRKITVEVNSINNRYCDIQIRLPKAFADYEYELKEMIAGRISRGKVVVNIGIEEDPALAAKRLDLNSDMARMYGRVLRDLKAELNLPGEIEVGHFVNLPDLIKPAEEQLEGEELLELVKKCLGQALDELSEMRCDEGCRLIADIKIHIDNIAQSLALAEKSLSENLRVYSDKLRLRLRDLLSGMPVSEEIIANEAALVAERADITEECVRIRSHLDMFREAYAGDEPVGKKMNFILQELYREANTIGSKSLSPEISRQVIIMKEEIEKAREQVQNLE